MRILSPIRAALAVMLVCLLTTTAAAQQGERKASLMGGVGNTFGWLGAAGEFYLKDRIALVGGLGYVPEFDAGEADGVAFAGGARLFTRGRTHRAFVESSYSVLARELGGPNPRLRYGPSIQIGWHYAAKGGFSVLASAGVGVITDDVPPGADRLSEALNIGIGYTWRR